MKQKFTKRIAAWSLAAAATALLPAGAALHAQTPAAKALAFFNFDNASNTNQTKDVLHGFAGNLEAGASFTADGTGHTGKPGDRAVSFSGARRLVRVAANWLNAFTGNDSMTVSFWEKLNSTPNASAFWFVSPSSTSSQRGFQAHAPYGDKTIYFDTSGCCDPGLQRISQNITAVYEAFDFTTWHHWTFVKDGAVKQVWIDGVLFLEGSNTNPLPTDFTEFTIGAAFDGGGVVDGVIDDFAVFASGLPESTITSIVQGASPASLDKDTDADGLPDWWEDLYALNKNDKADASLDADSDGLSNSQEYAAGTNPKNPDSDGDGLKDGVETGTRVFVSLNDRGTDPNNRDTDADGLTDDVETNSGTFVNKSNTGSNPFIVDTDGDGLTDSDEVLLGSSPLDKASVPTKAGKANLLALFNFNDPNDPAKTVDTAHGIVGTVFDPAIYTADGGGHSGQPGDYGIDFSAASPARVNVKASWVKAAAMNDKMTVTFWENLYGRANSSAFWFNAPAAAGARGFQAHSPYGDGTIYFDSAGCCGADTRISKKVADDFDVAQWHHFAFVKNGAIKQIYIDGVLFLSAGQAAKLPLEWSDFNIGADGAGNGRSNGVLDDFAVFASALDISQIKALATGSVSPQDFDRDTDNDSIPDLYEDAHALNKNDPTDAAKDLDNDGSTNLQEYLAGTDPQNKDTDGDGIPDGSETKTGVYVSATNTGTDPLNTDTDGDGLPDNVETNTGRFVDQSNPGTSPVKADTDGDGFEDLRGEIQLGKDPNDKNSVAAVKGRLNLLAFWDFNTDGGAEAVDKVKGYAAQLEPVETPPILSDGRLGHTGRVEDRAMDFGVDNGLRNMHLTNALWLNAGAGLDQITVSMWERIYDIQAVSMFWFISPAGGGRGFQAHVPWSDSTVYFDTAGCCEANTRISKNLSTVNPDPATWLADWHHFVFIKNGTTKQIYIDGVLFHSGTGAAKFASDFNEIFIGSGPTGSANMHGLVDDFAIFAGAPSADQVKALFNGTSPLDLEPPLPATPTLSFAVSGGGLKLTFTGKLQSADSVKGPWADVNATSPADIATTGKGKFYRTSN